MEDDLLERYIAEHIETCPDQVVLFSWHGGEPTLLGLDYFQKIVRLERKHSSGRRIVNGIQTNGTLLTDEWCRFLAQEGFAVGISLDGPQELHDGYRRTKGGEPTHHLAMRGYDLLQKHKVPFNVLCVLHSQNVRRPLEVYRFFKQIEAEYIGFLPLVEIGTDGDGVSDRTVPSEAFGAFLCKIFNEWTAQDIGRVKVQIFEEAARTALGQDHELCIFKERCGDVVVLERDGDFFCCDHFVDRDHLLGNIREIPLSALIDDPRQEAFGRSKCDTLPRYCRRCEVLSLCNGGCPKDRILRTPEGEAGLNYLCAGYRAFFNHCRPFLDQLSALRSRQSLQPQRTPTAVKSLREDRKIGRNDPCPCGSGRKYKKCCMGRSARSG